MMRVSSARWTRSLLLALASRLLEVQAVLLGRTVSYLAFGSNMHPAVLTRKRSVVPVSQMPAAAEGWRLGFSLRGGGAEPSFASAEPDARRTLYGVLFELEALDWAKVCATEGVPFGYVTLPIRCRPLDADGRPDFRRPAELAWTLTASPGPARIADEADEPRPSERYLSYLRDGARLSGLPAHWRSHLDGLSRDPAAPTAVDPADAAWLAEAGYEQS